MNEPNPIYWLESRHDMGLQAVLLLAGIAMSVFLCLEGISNGIDQNLFWLYAIPMAFFALGPLVIPLGGTRRFMDQQYENDLILQVPMTPREILWGKLQTTLNLLVCLFGPTLPGVLVCLLTGHSEWSLGVFTGFCATLSLSLVGYGFAAGCRTPVLRGIMIVLGGIFTLSLFPVFWMVAFFVHEIHQAGYTSDSYLYFCGSVFILIASGFIYRMGVLILRANRDLPEILFVISALSGGVFVFTAFMIVYVNRMAVESLIMLIPWVAFYGAPLLAMLAVVVNDRTRGRIVY